MPSWLRRLVLLAFLLGAVPQAAAAQGASVRGQVRGQVTGRVTDAATGQPLQGVNVFVAGTLRGAATDAEGRYRIAAVPPGAHQLVASMLGYAAQQRAVRLAPGTTHTTDFALQPVVYEAGALEVTADRPRQWRRHLARFERLFLGETPNAARCRLVNPYVLDFRTDDGTFRASARAPLVIENEALGYRLTYLLHDFAMEPDGVTLRFRGLAYFTERTPADEAEAARWAAHREKTYRGSFQHFLRALARGTAAAEGFRLHAARSERALRFALQTAPLLPASVVADGPEPYERVLHVEDLLHVTYTRADAEAAYRHAHPNAAPGQQSVLRLRRPAVFNTLGFLNDPYAVARAQYWHWTSRVADLLPLDYAPPEAP